METQALAKTTVERMTNLKSALEKQLPAMKAIAASHLNPERMLKIALLAASRNRRLLECTPGSIVRSVMQSCELGLEAGSFTGEAHLVPYWNTKVGYYEAQLIPGYRGLINLVRETGEISTLYAEAVYLGDEFEVTLGLDPNIRHKPNWSSEERESAKNLTFVYAVCKFKDGGVQFSVMSRKQVDAIRARSQAKESGPWVTDFEEMAKKTVIRRLSKYLPMHTKMEKAMQLQAAAESGDFNFVEIDSEVVEPPKEPETGIEKLKKRLGRPPKSEQAIQTKGEAPQIDPEPPVHEDGASQEQGGTEEKGTPAEMAKEMEKFQNKLIEKISKWSPSVRASYEMAIRKAKTIDELLEVNTVISDREGSTR